MKIYLSVLMVSLVSSLCLAAPHGQTNQRHVVVKCVKGEAAAIVSAGLSICRDQSGKKFPLGMFKFPALGADIDMLVIRFNLPNQPTDVAGSYYARGGSISFVGGAGGYYLTPNKADATRASTQANVTAVMFAIQGGVEADLGGAMVLVGADNDEPVIL